ncbi:hypothetical protein KM043_013824 [Ampulex compressa]|nr:hypothetical protein KM043_013824 [Ampulex compressa]
MKYPYQKHPLAKKSNAQPLTKHPWLRKPYFDCSSVETVDEGSVTTSVAVAEVADSQEQHQQQQSKSNVSAARRVAGQSVALGNSNGTSNVGRVTPRSHMEHEKRMRREIANSNERRRMQSINAGFQSLRTLLPHHEGEKLSKHVKVTSGSHVGWTRMIG